MVILEDIGVGDDALLCITTLTACCNDNSSALGNWFFPNGTKVPSSDEEWDFHRTRGQSVVLLHRRRGGVEGIYRCEIPDAMNVNQTIYIGVYSASTGEWYMYMPSSSVQLATLILQHLNSRTIRVSLLLVHSAMLESHSSAPNHCSMTLVNRIRVYRQQMCWFAGCVNPCPVSYF